MYTRCNASINVIKHFRSVSTTVCLPSKSKSHYDSLGITPKATQADVKTAYYELSKVYHPDKSKGSADNADKFRDISEAYEVLGNVKLRRLYDRGMYHGTHTIVKPEEEEDPVARFYKSRERRSKPPMTGRTPIYDFDEWSRQHYGATFKKDQESKQRQEFLRKKKEDDIRDGQIERILYGMGFFLVILFYIMREDYDTDTRSVFPTIRKNPDKPER